MSRIIDARLRYTENVCAECYNSPTVEVLVDKLPTSDELTYDVRRDEHGGSVYVAVCGDIAYMYYHNAHLKHRDDAIVPVTLRSGEKKLLVGPWLTCSQSSADVGLTPLVESSVFTCKESWENNGKPEMAVYATLAAYTSKLNR